MVQILKWKKEEGEVIEPLFELFSPDPNKLYIDVNEMTITVSGNAKLWDVGFSEQKYWWNKEKQTSN